MQSGRGVKFDFDHHFAVLTIFLKRFKTFSLTAYFSAHREDHFQKINCPKQTFRSDFVKLGSEIGTEVVRLSASPIIRVADHPRRRLSASPIIRVADYPRCRLSASPIIRVADNPRPPTFFFGNLIFNYQSV